MRPGLPIRSLARRWSERAQVRGCGTERIKPSLTAQASKSGPDGTPNIGLGPRIVFAQGLGPEFLLCHAHTGRGEFLRDFCVPAYAYGPMLTGRCMRADAYGPMHVGRCMLADARWPKWRALLAPNPPAFFSPGLPRFRDFLKTCNAVVGARIELNRNLKDMLSVDRRVCANRGASAGARNARGG
jgi:hypothetical protein